MGGKRPANEYPFAPMYRRRKIKKRKKERRVVFLFLITSSTRTLLVLGQTEKGSSSIVVVRLTGVAPYNILAVQSLPFLVGCNRCVT